MAKTKILYVSGIDDTNQVEVLLLAPSQKDIKFKAHGNVDLLSLLNAEVFEIFHVTVGGMMMDDLRISPVDLVLNAVCNPDISQKSLKAVKRIVEALPRPVFNHPENILKTGRDSISRLFAHVQNIILPKTIRFQPGRLKDVIQKIEFKEISFPFIFREAGFHAGQKMQLIRTLDEIHELEKFAMDGRDFYATEFIDFVSADGFYRKYRAVVVGGVPYPRHMIISDSWNVHAENRKNVMLKNPALIEEEKIFVETFGQSHSQVFRTFYEKLDLDFFGVDFAYDAVGEMIIFEINSAFRVIGAGDEDEYVNGMKNYHKPAIEKIKKAVEVWIVSKVRPI
jgi:glutathione synthase/RimK-type ligase-like ATP-grasp enzyme